jgi:hypothetical protein
MAVFGISGRRVGVVKEIGDHCFAVARDEADGRPICLTSESIFTVDRRGGVTLVCSREDVERYECTEHSPG